MRSLRSATIEGKALPSLFKLNSVSLNYETDAAEPWGGTDNLVHGPIPWLIAHAQDRGAPSCSFLPELGTRNPLRDEAHERECFGQVLARNEGEVEGGYGFFRRAKVHVLIVR